jgi:hypothetical protein
MSATTSSRLGRVPSAAAPLACAGCLLAGAVYVAINDPSDGATFLPCPFRLTTGLWCPGCGLTRATNHLVRGDVVQALRYNILVVAVLGLIATSWYAWYREARGRPLAWVSRVPAWAYGVAVAVAMGFAVVRNLPGVSGLRG